MFESMYLYDFCLYKGVTLSLKDQGLVWVEGVNKDTVSSSSNASGKSTVFKGISWVLYGRTIHGKCGDEIIRNGCEMAIGAVKFSNGYQVIRKRSKGLTNVSIFKHNVEILVDKSNVQDKIIEIIGFDFVVFKNTIMFGQGDVTRFANPLTSDFDRKEILYKIMKTQILKKCHKISLIKTSEIKENIAKFEREKILADEGRLRVIDNIEQIEKRCIEWDNQKIKRIQSSNLILEKHKKLNEDQISIDELSKLQLEYEEKKILAENDLKRIENNESVLSKIYDATVKLNREEDKTKTEIMSKQHEYDNLAAKLSKTFEMKKCYECGSVLSSKKIDEMEVEINKRLGTLNTDINILIDVRCKIRDESFCKKKEFDNYESIDKDSDYVRNKFNECTENLNVVKDQKLLFERSYEKLAEYEQNLKNIKEEKNPHVFYLGKELELKKTFIENIALCENELDKLNKEHVLYKYWNNGYSNQGLPSYILDEIVPFLTDRANHYLLELSDGDIVLDFNTQRKLKSKKGKYREEINIKWTIEEVEGYPLSGGELRKIEIATNLALLDLIESRNGCSINLFIADEILDGLDREGVSRVVKLFQSLIERRKTIFVISHKQFMSDGFENFITVTKENKISKLKTSKGVLDES